jgi:hypothetical protein
MSEFCASLVELSTWADGSPCVPGWYVAKTSDPDSCLRLSNGVGGNFATKEDAECAVRRLTELGHTVDSVYDVAALGDAALRELLYSHLSW